MASHRRSWVEAFVQKDLNDYRVLLVSLEWCLESPYSRCLILPGKEHLSVEAWIYDFLTRTTTAAVWESLLDKFNVNEIELSCGQNYGIHVARIPNLTTMRVQEYSQKQSEVVDKSPVTEQSFQLRLVDSGDASWCHNDLIHLLIRKDELTYQDSVRIEVMKYRTLIVDWNRPGYHCCTINIPANEKHPKGTDGGCDHFAKTQHSLDLGAKTENSFDDPSQPHVSNDMKPTTRPKRPLEANDVGDELQDRTPRRIIVEADADDRFVAKRPRMKNYAFLQETRAARPDPPAGTDMESSDSESVSSAALSTSVHKQPNAMPELNADAPEVPLQQAQKSTTKVASSPDAEMSVTMRVTVDDPFSSNYVKPAIKSARNGTSILVTELLKSTAKPNPEGLTIAVEKSMQQNSELQQSVREFSKTVQEADDCSSDSLSVSESSSSSNSSSDSSSTGSSNSEEVRLEAEATSNASTHVRVAQIRKNAFDQSWPRQVVCHELPLPTATGMSSHLSSLPKEEISANETTSLQKTLLFPSPIGSALCDESRNRSSAYAIPKMAITSLESSTTIACVEFKDKVTEPKINSLKHAGSDDDSLSSSCSSSSSSSSSNSSTSSSSATTSSCSMTSDSPIGRVKVKLGDSAVPNTAVVNGRESFKLQTDALFVEKQVAAKEAKKGNIPRAVVDAPSGQVDDDNGLDATGAGNTDETLNGLSLLPLAIVAESTAQELKMSDESKSNGATGKEQKEGGDSLSTSSSSSCSSTPTSSANSSKLKKTTRHANGSGVQNVLLQSVVLEPSIFGPETLTQKQRTGAICNKAAKADFDSSPVSSALSSTRPAYQAQQAIESAFRTTSCAENSEKLALSTENSGFGIASKDLFVKGAAESQGNGANVADVLELASSSSSSSGSSSSSSTTSSSKSSSSSLSSSSSSSSYSSHAGVTKPKSNTIATKGNKEATVSTKIRYKRKPLLAPDREIIIVRPKHL